jgi:uncharacterized damage-inducible protein DinB
MSPPVSLKKVIEELEMPSIEAQSYLHKPTAEIVCLTDEALQAAEVESPLEDHPDWMRPLIQQARDFLNSEEDYLSLPGKMDFNEYAIMESFCLSMRDARIRERLLGKIRGKGAFRRFRNSIHSMGIEEDWYEFRNKALEEVAIEWLEENEIPYVRDSSSSALPAHRNTRTPAREETSPTVEASRLPALEAAQTLRELVEDAADFLAVLSEAEVTERPAPGKWSKKEILGHLLDSASNNHQRFVRAQLGPQLCFPDYEQEAWVHQQAYSEMEWKQLVELWRLYNRLLAHVLARIPKELLATPCRIGMRQAVPLASLITHYLGHTVHHLGQMVT